MPDTTTNNRRQDFRVNDVIPMNDELISKDEFNIRRNHIGIRSRQNSMLRSMVGSDIFSKELNGKLNTDLAQAMEALDTKLNYLIGVNMLNDAQQNHLNERAIDLSVTGASFVSEHPYEQGSPIYLTLMLPAFPPTTLELLGEVMWVRNKADKQPLIGVRFIFRCSEEEDTLTKYVFRRHREMIRLSNQDISAA